MKTCTACGVEKPLTEFNKHAGCKDGLAGVCKACQCAYNKGYHEKNKDKRREYLEKNKDKTSERQREYRDKNKDKISERHREYREKNKDKISEQRRAYRDKNKDKISEYSREYRDKNKARRSKYQREYNEKNKDKIGEQRREYLEKNKEKLIERRRESYKNNPGKYREIKRKTRYGLTNNDVDQMLYGQCGLCAVCHRPGKETLHIDHDHGTGQARGLLCRACNRGIGKFRDSIDTLLSAAKYLTMNKPVAVTAAYDQAP